MATTKRKSSSAAGTKSKGLSRIGREAWGLALLFLALFTLMSLVSFNHADPSMFTRTARLPSNWGGRVGANLSEVLIQGTGMAAYLVVALLLGFAVRFFQGASPLQIIGNVVWIILAYVAGSTLLSLELGMVRYGGLAVSCGGLLGSWLADTLRHYFNLWGSTLITLCVLLISVVFATPLSAKTMGQSLKLSARALWIAVKATASGAWSLMKRAAEQSRALRDARQDEAVARIVIGTEVETPAPRGPSRPAEDTSDFGDQLELVIEERKDLHLDPTPRASAKPAKSSAARASQRKRLGEPLSGAWALPTLDFLKDPAPKLHELNRLKLTENAKNVEAKLAEFGITGQVVAVRPGPVITMYEFRPGTGVKISSIASRADDLSLALEAQSVRIVAPIPGKSVVGIEIPNDTRETVMLKELLTTADFTGSEQAIPIAVGKDASGAPIITDIAATPHLLIAGSSGAGKSVFVNTLITSLLYKFTPRDLRMIMVDPKQLELALYDKIPHLLLPVVDDPQKASTALRWACNEMERRYTIMARSGVRNLKGFNQKLEVEGAEKVTKLLCPVNEDGTAGALSVAHMLEHDDGGKPVVEHLPTIVVIIDEFADLMMVARKEIENHVARLAAKARAAGIHLIIATQRPSTDVITGVIKNNLPSRVAFKVPSQIDSRTILDTMGAEKLLGKGDMLFIPPGASRLVRAHGAYIDEEEIVKICDFWRSQGEPDYREDILTEPEIHGQNGDGTIDGVADPLYQQAIAIVREEGSASASRLQRRMGVGYNRAARIIESMEEQGIVGPASGSKPREVIY